MSINDSPSGRPRRVFLDCTRTHHYDARTGIPRVVRNVANLAREVGRELGMDCRPVVFQAGAGFVSINRLPAPGTLSPRGPGRTVRTVVRKTQLREWAKRVLSRFGLMDPAHRLYDRLQQVAFGGLRLIRRLTRKRGLQLGPGDVLLLLDASWTVPFWSDVQHAQQRGARIGFVVYDLLPLRRPEFFRKQSIRNFRNWWTTAAEVADFCICISHTVWEDVQAMLQEDGRGGQRRLAGGSFRLGADIDGGDGDVQLRTEIERIFSAAPAEPAYMVVGTLDPRKNHALVLDAFDRLWSGGARVRLLLAGKYGACPEGLLERLQRHPEYERRLFWRDDIRDGELRQCYRRAAALITASHDEGFNLPIVEALQQGCPVLASDVPVHREVGGDYAAYFALGQPALLAEMVAAHQRSGMLTNVPPREAFHWPDWTESCCELLLRTRELSDRPQSLLPRIQAARRAA